MSDEIWNNFSILAPKGKAREGKESWKQKIKNKRSFRRYCLEGKRNKRAKRFLEFFPENEGKNENGIRSRRRSCERKM